MDFSLTDEQRLIRDTVRDFARNEVAPGRRGARPHQVVSLRARREDGRAGADGHPVRRGVRGRRSRHARVCPRRRGARPDRLVGRHHARRAHLARHDADQPLGHRRAEGGLAARALRGPQARGLRPDRARGRLGRRRHPHAGEARRRRVGDRRRQAVHHQRRDRHLRLRDDHGRHGLGQRPARDLEHHRPERHARLRGGRAVPQDGLERVRHAPAHASTAPAFPRRTSSGRRGDGFKQFLHILDGGRIGVSAMGIGLAQGALDEAIAYANERKAFGQPIGKFQAIQAKIADISAQLEAARLLTYRCAHPKGRGRVVHAHRRAGEAHHRPPGRPRARGGGPDPRRLRLHRGVPRLPLLPRREDPHHRRGHRRGPADGDRPRPWGFEYGV